MPKCCYESCLIWLRVLQGLCKIQNRIDYFLVQKCITFRINRFQYTLLQKQLHPAIKFLTMNCWFLNTVVGIIYSRKKICFQSLWKRLEYIANLKKTVKMWKCLWVISHRFFSLQCLPLQVLRRMLIIRLSQLKQQQQQQQQQEQQHFIHSCIIELQCRRGVGVEVYFKSWTILFLSSKERNNLVEQRKL